jgi:hypothetical protein
MNKSLLICGFRRAMLAGALAVLFIYAFLAANAPNARAAVSLLYFTATPGSDTILVVWETATEQDIIGFKLYRSQDSGSKGQQIGDIFPSQGDGISGARYDYSDTNLLKGVRYYYSLEEITASGGLTVIATANAGIDLPTLTPTPTATATATFTATATRTPTATRASSATNVPGGTSGDQPTATRQFTNTPPPATAAPGSTPTSILSTSATATPIGAGVVSTPTGGPPTVAPINAAATTVPTPLPPAEPTALAESPSPEIVPTSVVQPVDEATPTATQPPQVFAAATAPSLQGAPERTAAAPTSVPADGTTRNTGSMLVLGGGAILLAAAIGGGVLLYLRSRRS